MGKLALISHTALYKVNTFRIIIYSTDSLTSVHPICRSAGESLSSPKSRSLRHAYTHVVFPIRCRFFACRALERAACRFARQVAPPCRWHLTLSALL